MAVYFVPPNHFRLYWKKVWFFCPQMTLRHFPAKKNQEFFTVVYLILGKWCGFFVHKWRSLNSQKNFLWIFCPQMTLTQFPICGFFVHNFQIGVKQLNTERSFQTWIFHGPIHMPTHIPFLFHWPLEWFQYKQEDIPIVIPCFIFEADSVVLCDDRVFKNYL